MNYGAFLKTAKDTIKDYDMAGKDDKILVAVSGGADSVALVKVLLDAYKNNKKCIIVANMDHGLRGSESRKESLFVNELAKSLGLEFVHKKINLKAKKKAKAHTAILNIGFLTFICIAS